MAKRIRKNKLPKWAEYIVAIATIFFALIGIGWFVAQLTYTPRVSYVKDVAAYQEGDGIVIYAIMADSSGQMVKAKGNLKLKVTLTQPEWQGCNLVEKEYSLYTDDLRVEQADFINTTVGMGVFEHNALILPYGRISFSELGINPRNSQLGIGTLNVYVEFKEEEGRSIQGNTVCIVS